MQAKEKFNNIVYKIEELVWEAEYMKAYEISEEAFAAGECYIDDRSKNTLFLFLVGSTVIDYINERRMMAAYKHLITMKKKNFKKVIDLSGVQEHSSFVRKFRKQFGMSPTQAFDKKDESRIFPIKDWDQISQEGKSIFVKLEEDENILREKRFGISKEMYIRAQRAENLQSFYKLNDLESEFAFGLSDSHSVSLDDAFEYVYNYVWVYAEDKVSDDADMKKRDVRIKEDLLNEDTVYLYFDCGPSFEDIYILLLVKHINDMKESWREVEPMYLQGCLQYMQRVYLDWVMGFDREEDFRLKFRNFQKAHQYFQEKKTETYTEYDYKLYLSLTYFYDIITAWAMVNPGLQSDKEVKQVYDKIYVDSHYMNTYESDYNEIEMRRERLYAEDGFYEREFYGENYYDEEECDYEYDMDDPENIQDSYMSFNRDDNMIEMDLDDDFDEESFEKLCELEEMDKLEEEIKPKRVLSGHVDLNVEECF